MVPIIANIDSIEKQKEHSWSEVFEVLSNKWKENCSKPLELDDSYYLACMAFQDNNISLIDFNDKRLTFKQLETQNLPNRNHTFMKWFDSMMILTQEYLSALWKEDFVIGFISRHKANAMLEISTEGTFLLRFSESVLGGVTIGQRLAKTSSQSVRWLAPFTKQELALRGIADMISDLSYLKTFYPNIPKSNIEEFKSQRENHNNDFVSINLNHPKSKGYEGTIQVKKAEVDT